MRGLWFKMLLFVVFGLGSWWVFNNKEVILSPVSNKKEIGRQRGDLVTFGFLPTWMVEKTREYGSEVSHLIFLGVEADNEGNLIWDTQSNKIKNETYLRQKKLISKSGGKNILGIKLFDDEKLKKLLMNGEARENLVKQIIETVKENDYDGVNVDFEFQNDPLAVLGEEFGIFLEELDLAQVGEISVDVFANTVIKGSEEQLKSLIEKIDYLVVMAYDFHRPGVNYAGPVAPISSNPGERNINEVVESCVSGGFLKTKIVMAYPLYGYEWKTETEDFESRVIRGWYQMASWNRTKELIKEKKLSVNWDELSMSPWISFKESGVIHQIYFENQKSLKAKIDLVRQNQFAGYGFWALGYEGEDKTVWQF